MLRLATDPRINVSLPDLRERHTILDILDLHATLDMFDEAEG